MQRLTLIALTLALLLALALAAGLAQAGSSATYAINWQVLAGGGGPVASTAGGVSLNGTLGQPVIGPSAGGAVTLGAGYWHAGAASPVYLPIILRAP
jgi:hypothetical protein